MRKYPHRLEMEVRDYECDLQGIVNNSVYQNYLEHARHCFLRDRGVDFAGMTARGIFLVVTRAELDYRFPLRSGDRFWVGTQCRRATRVRFSFRQDIFRLEDDRVVMNAVITGTALDVRGRPDIPPELEGVLGLPDAGEPAEEE